MNVWGDRSQRVYRTLHADLQVLFDTVLQVHDCGLVQGHRTPEEHAVYLAEGRTQVPYARTLHRYLPSRAVDAIPTLKGVDAYDTQQVLFFAGVVLGTAEQLRARGFMRYPIRLGADWDSDRNVVEHLAKGRFFDGVHFELIGVSE